MPRKNKFTHISSISYKPMITLMPGSESNFPRDSVSSAISIRLEQQVRDQAESSKASESAAESQESAGSDEDDDGMALGDEWEGVVVEEVFDQGILKFKVAWVPTLEPAENLSVEMRSAWEKKKSESRANVSKAGKCGIKKRPGRPRKHY